MTFAIGVTDLDWFATHRRESLGSEVNFWTPTPWNVTKLSVGEPWYFMLKSPIRKIGGYGLFREYNNLSVSHAWRRYGVANGVSDQRELFDRIIKYTTKHSVFPNTGDDPIIGCLILSEPTLFDEVDYFTPEDYGLAFPRQIVKYKMFDGLEIPYSLRAINTPQEFQLVLDNKAERRRVPVKDRKGQSEFRQSVLRAYGSQCVVTETNLVEVLQAAHIQPYMDERSNHIQNGLCLRADIHALFDEGLISVDSDYGILISQRVMDTSKDYKHFHGRKLRLSNNPTAHPSKEALKYHQLNVFVD